MLNTISLIGSYINKLLIFLFLLLGVAFSNEGRCVAGGTESTDLGPYPSFSIRDNTEIIRKKMAGTGLVCNFKSVLTLGLLGGGDKIKTTLETYDLFLKNEYNPAAKIGFALYADQEFSEIITPGKPITYNMKKLLDLLGLFGDGDKNMDIPMYIVVLPVADASQLIAGRYTANLVFQWEWAICKGIGISLGIQICLGRDTGTAITNVIINLDITPDCLISATNIHFGARAFVTEFEPVNGIVTVTCTKGTAYSVGLDNGENAEGNQRRMRFGKDYIAYNINKENGGDWRNLAPNRWSSSDASERPGPGNGLRNGGQIYKYKAEIMSDVGNTPKPAGTYIDHVVIDIGF